MFVVKLSGGLNMNNIPPTGSSEIIIRTGGGFAMPPHYLNQFSIVIFAFTYPGGQKSYTKNKITWDG